MNRSICTACHLPIPNGEAVVRSSNFVQVPYHHDCWVLDRARRQLAFERRTTAADLPALLAPYHT